MQPNPYVLRLIPIPTEIVKIESRERGIFNYWTKGLEAGFLIRLEILKK